MIHDIGVCNTEIDSQNSQKMIIWPIKSLMICMNTIIDLSVSYYPSEKQASKSDTVKTWMICAEMNSNQIELVWDIYGGTL